MVGFVFFSAGFLGLLGFFGLHVFESRRSVRLFPKIRARADRAAALFYRTLVFGEIPRTYREQLIVRTRQGIHTGVNVLITLLRAAERPLSRMSRRMRYMDVENGAARTPSTFLKDMASEREGHSKKPESPL